jgi:hypothetical protein
MPIGTMGRRLALAASVAVLAGTAAQANHSWGGYHWPMTSSGQTPVALDRNLNATWSPYLDAARADWDLSTKLAVNVSQGSASPRTCRSVTGRVQVCNYTYGANGWLGIAQIWISGVHITKGVVKVNDTYFNTATYNHPKWRDMVMCQEVGHIFGLGHQDENFNNPNLGTCMDYTNDPARNDGAGNNLAPNQHDYDQLVAIYTPHGDVATSSASNTPFAAEGAADDAGGERPGEWGRAVAFTSDGRGRVFERATPNGGRVITHVFWTMERHQGHH